MSMIHLVILAVHLLSTIAKLVRPGGVRTVVAESLVLKQQLLISSRSRRRAPNLNSFDRFVLGLGSLFVTPSRIPKLAVILKPGTLLRFHEALKKRKYRWLFSSGGHRRPGPKGPSKELIDAIVEFKRRNPRVGCPRIAQEIAHAFGIDIDKDIVRRVLAKHYRPEAGTDGPSWLSFIGHMKDSLWSVDLFRCESILLRSHWVMVVMDVSRSMALGSAAHSKREALTYITGHRVFAEYLLLVRFEPAPELTIFCGALVGASLGFLWYNAHPAEIFMGDVGSLALGGALATVAILIKQELLLVIVGGVFVLEAASVVIQVVSFKFRGKRVFKMAPLHHHFELSGWEEPKVITRFLIIAILFALFSLTTLKLR